VNQNPIYGAVPSTVGIYRSWKEEVQIKVVPFTITPSKVLVPVSTTLYSADLDILVLRKEYFYYKES
jgi:hypothetical protein